MKEQNINQRFLDLAKRQRSEGFLEAEAKKSDEIRRLGEEERMSRRLEVEKARESYMESLDLKGSRREQFGEYMGDLNRFEGDELDTAMYAFFNHPDFPILYNQLGTIPKASDKWGFILRRAYEIGQEMDVFIGHVFQSELVTIKRKFEDYGVNVLCPYFRQNEESATKEECLIDEEPIMSSCQGEHDICSLFSDRAFKATSGEIQLPEINRPSPRINIPQINVDPVDLADLEDWWMGEGRYE